MSQLAIVIVLARKLLSPDRRWKHGYGLLVVVESQNKTCPGLQAVPSFVRRELEYGSAAATHPLHRKHGYQRHVYN